MPTRRSRPASPRIVLTVALLGTAIAAPSLVSAAPGATVIPLGPAPKAVTAFCHRRADRDRFPVLCPTRYPLTRVSLVTSSGDSLLGPSFYWASFNDEPGFLAGDHGHLVIGGQRPPFSLAGSAGQVWPRPGQPRPVQQLALPHLATTPEQGGGVYVAERPARILGRSTVRGHDALVLAAPPYPNGGFMGGHVIVLWNSHRHGYMLSFHFEVSRSGHAYSLATRVATALAVARSFAPVPR